MSAVNNSSFACCSTHSEEETVRRLSNYNKVAQSLRDLTDTKLSTLLMSAKPLGHGIGGQVLSTELDGVPLFIKKIPLTKIEQQNPKSTLNLFELPTYYQYGVGSMGFGAWREIAAHEMTTQWVLNGECQNFPLMYHSRVLQRPTQSETKQQTPEQAEDIKREVEYWEGSTAVAKRMNEVNTASADVVVFMEHLPQTLHKRLQANENKGDLSKIKRELNLVTAFMKSRGFLHFDAHFHNILAKNDHVYFADFGLAMSREFDLSQEEKAFLEKHIDYDRCYVMAELAKHTIAAALGEKAREEGLDAYLSSKKMTISLPSDVESIAQRCRPVAILMENFLNDLRNKSKSTPYPEAELAREI